jgi:1-deoxypentalenic acid 11beta-hydroxylase
MAERPSPLGQLREANEHLGDPDRLDALFQEQGYLFFRKVLEGVEDLKAAFVRELQQQGAAKPGEFEPVWNGAGLDQIDESRLYALLPALDLFRSGHNLQFLERIFGEPVFLFKGRSIRYVLPNDSAHLTPAHQDHFFIRWSDSLRTIWMPLMDIDGQMGGLALAEKSHKHGLREHVLCDDVYSYIFKDRKQRGIPAERIVEPWLTTDFHSGDLLMFHNLLIHRALPNRSDRIRLSVDTRCQPARDPHTWQAEKTEIEIRQLRETAKNMAIEQGASEPVFEVVFSELMRRNLLPERHHIRTLISELSRQS